MSRLDGKRVVITGAASGLGRSLALVLARKGCRIGIADINTAGAEETMKMVKQNGGSGETYKLDVSKPENVEAMAAHFFKAWRGVDLFINNAGVVSTGFVGDISLDDWRKVFSINFWGMLYGCHYVIPRMKAQGGGHILNVSSLSGFIAMMEMGPYNTSKAAVVSLSETLKWELSGTNIGITVLCPSFFKTNLLNNMSYTDEFEKEFAHASFDHAKISSDQVAKAAIKAVEKGKFYCIPQSSGRSNWRFKRWTPSSFLSIMAYINGKPFGRKFYMWLARNGLM
jgi:NAD(P)-dependent dehydrogenase (short-subunit alcohol dehydrogenase family)